MENNKLSIAKSVLSNNQFFIIGIKNLLSKELLNDYYTILDLDNIPHTEGKKMINKDKEIIAFASNDLSSLKAESFGSIPVLDKRCSVKNILSYFMLKNQSGIYHATIVLTKREREILYWLRKGISHDEISNKLNIKSKTIYTYRRNIMKKLGCENRIDFQKQLLRTQ